MALYHALTALAGFEPFLWLLRRAAFVVIERTAEQRGVQWRHAVQELKNNPEASSSIRTLMPAGACTHTQDLQVYQLKDELTDPDVELAYPAYYLKVGRCCLLTSRLAEASEAALVGISWIHQGQPRLEGSV